MASQLKVEWSGQKNVATQMLNDGPIKWIPTSSRKDEFRVFTSTYGGGYVQNDQVNIKIVVGENAKLSLESQANQHIYACEHQKNMIKQSIFVKTSKIVL